MKHFEIEGPVLKIKSTGQFSGCVFVFFGIFGFFLTFVGIIALVFSNGLESRFTGIFISVLGFAMFYAGLFSPAKGFKEEIYFDNTQKILKIQSNRQQGKPLIIAYHEISHLHCIETFRTGGRRQSLIYCLYAIKLDGSEIFLYYASLVGKITELVKELALFTGFEVRDTSKLQLARERQKEYQSEVQDFSKEDLHFSEFIDDSIPAMGKDLNNAFYAGKVLRLKQAKKTIWERMFLFMILAFFLSIPIALVMMAIQNPGQSKIFLIFMVPFALIFFSITIVMIVLSFKDYVVAIDGSGIRVRLKFRARLFSGLDRDLQIPREKIEFVRVNRSDNGYFWLALGVKDDFIITQTGSEFLFGTGVFKKENITKSSIRKEKVISLWEISPWYQAGKGPSYWDLHVLEKTIEEHLDLKEGKI